MRKGYIQVYTGDGKGKTTAALGLALRASGAGLKVLIAQFVKKKRCSEHRALERLGGLVTCRQYGTGFVMGQRGNETEVRAAQKGMREVTQLVASGEYDVVILDEINVSVRKGLVSVGDLLKLLDERPAGVEMVLTGRDADRRIIRRADLVTEMKEIRHYMGKGVDARKGIEM